MSSSVVAIMVRLSPDERRQVTERAQTEGISVNSLVRASLGLKPLMRPLAKSKARIAELEAEVERLKTESVSG